MIVRTELDATLEDHQAAFTEVCFLLDVLTRTIGDVVGQSQASLAINAGRHMGRKLPVHIENPDLPQVAEALRNRFHEGFEIAVAADAVKAELTVDRCAIREVCRERNLEVGGELCRMLHFYWSGIMSHLLGRPVRVGDVTAGESCRLCMEAK